MCEQNLCLFALSKNLQGRIGRAEGERRECQDPECRTLMIVHPLEFERPVERLSLPTVARIVGAHLELEGPVHVYDGDGMEHGLHSGEFHWRAEDTPELSGITNGGALEGVEFVCECRG